MNILEIEGKPEISASERSELENIHNIVVKRFHTEFLSLDTLLISEVQEFVLKELSNLKFSYDGKKVRIVGDRTVFKRESFKFLLKGSGKKLKIRLQEGDFITNGDSSNKHFLIYPTILGLCFRGRVFKGIMLERRRSNAEPTLKQARAGDYYIDIAIYILTEPDAAES